MTLSRAAPWDTDAHALEDGFRVWGKASLGHVSSPGVPVAHALERQGQSLEDLGEGMAEAYVTTTANEECGEAVDEVQEVSRYLDG